VNVYPFIEAEKVGQGNVARACALLKVSRSAYYQWSKHEPSSREQQDRELSRQIQEVHDESRHTYGAPRVEQALRRQGVGCGRKRVARLMSELGLVGRCPRRWKQTTIPDPGADGLPEDLLQRQFKPGRVNVAWAGDITYVRTWEGWLYVASVIDLESRRVVGWAMADHMRAELVCDALRMAIQGRRPPAGLIFHSDRGSQYTSVEFKQLLTDHEVRQSLSRPRQCWDNAVVESFWATLKTELVDRQAWPTRALARQAIFEFIEVFYNRRRLHSALSYQSPAEYEAEHLISSQAA
jgi:transposase InsO family protein